MLYFHSTFVLLLYGIQPGQGQMEANKNQLQLLGAPHSEPALDIKQPEPIQDVKALKPIMISSNGKKDQFGGNLFSLM